MSSSMVLNNGILMLSTIACYWNSGSNALSNHVWFQPFFIMCNLLVDWIQAVVNHSYTLGFKVDIFMSTLTLDEACNYEVITPIVNLLNSWQNACLKGHCRITSTYWWMLVQLVGIKKIWISWWFLFIQDLNSLLMYTLQQPISHNISWFVGSCNSLIWVAR